MFAGMPIAFALGAVATHFHDRVHAVVVRRYDHAERLRGNGSITLLSIPLFILKGAAIGRSRAGQDLYGALHAWLHRIPGGLGIANVFACALFAAMAGSSPATCSAIGSAGIPQMRKHGYSGGFAAGIIAAGGTLGILLPPSITMILYAVAAEQSLGPAVSGGDRTGAFAGRAFSPLTRCGTSDGNSSRPRPPYEKSGTHSEILRVDNLSMRDKFALLPRVLPFVMLLTGVMIALYGGFATPSETAGLGAVLALVLIAHDLQRVVAARSRADPDVDAARIDNADADHRHVAALFVRDELSPHQPIDR